MAGPTMNGNGNGAPPPLGALLAARRPAMSARQLRQLDKDDLKQWIREMSAPGRRKEERYLVFGMDHEHDEQGLVSCGLMGTIDPKAKGDTLEAAIDRIVGMVDRHSWSIAGRSPRGQFFKVGAALTVDPNEHAQETYPFNVDPPPDVAAQFHQRGVGGEASETNLGAVVGHLQRLIERFGDKVENLVELIVTENERVRSHNERLMTDRWEMTQKHEQLADEHAFRTIKVEQARAEMALTNEVKLELTRFLMKFGKSYVRAKFGGSPAEQDGKIVASIKKIAPPHLLKLVAVMNELPEEERGDLDSVFEAVIEDMPADKRSAMLALMQAEAMKQAEADAEKQRDAAAVPTEGAPAEPAGGKVGA